MWRLKLKPGRLDAPKRTSDLIWSYRTEEEAEQVVAISAYAYTVQWDGRPFVVAWVLRGPAAIYRVKRACGRI